MPRAHPSVRSRLDELERHLARENPVLVEVVRAFRRLDGIAYRMRLLRPTESYATKISWWPLVSILGTFSSGKSTFVNHVLGRPLQRTGNQAVDDRFTVICYSKEPGVHVLPGVALDADPRFPFYRISEELERVAPGEGRRIDAYLQLKACDCEELRGKIMIDSPGFDADAQRTSVLRMVDHIIDLSDLVLVFFDARHPEPGSMRDTLDHLVAGTIHRHDSGKFLYVLNQLDTTAREDNAEEVVAAWQRSLAEKGLTAGRFYSIYTPEAAVAIEDPELRARYESKRDRDLGEILARIRQVEVSRAYRVVEALGQTSSLLTDRAVPVLQEGLRRWRSHVLTLDAVVFGVILAVLLAASVTLGWWDGLAFRPAWWQDFVASPWLGWLVLAAVVLGGLWVHFWIRRLAAASLAPKVAEEGKDAARVGDIGAAFLASTQPPRPLWAKRPRGFGRGAGKRARAATGATSGHVQALNDHFARPSGDPMHEQGGDGETAVREATPQAPKG